MIRSDRRPLAACLLACATLALGSPVHAVEYRLATLADLPPPPHPPLLAAIAPRPITMAQGGQLIFLDEETGAIARTQPDSADIAAATQGLPRVVVDFTVRTGPAGDIYIDTTGVHETATAVLAADGSLHIDCGHPADHPTHAAPERKP